MPEDTKRPGDRQKVEEGSEAIRVPVEDDPARIAREQEACHEAGGEDRSKGSGCDVAAPQSKGHPRAEGSGTQTMKAQGQNPKV